MTDMTCPLCGSQSFYVKDPEDPYQIYKFNLAGGKILISPGAGGESETPEIVAETETYCGRCAWHGKFHLLKRAG
jgi:hypothetical protein